MLNELMCNVHLVKIQVFSSIFILFFELLTRRTLQSSSSTINSYGDFATPMVIYHDKVESPRVS